MTGGYGQEDQGPGRSPLPPELSPRGRRAASGTRSSRAGRVSRSRGRRAVRYASWIGVTASVLMLVLAGGAFAYYQHLNGNVHRVPFLAGQAHQAGATNDGAENILVVGDDSRTGATAQQLQQAGTTQDGGSNNTDTIIIVHLAPNGGPATLISIPRDSFVPIPGHGTFKINSAYADGEADKAKGLNTDGPTLLAQTVEHLTGLHIDHFLAVGLFQFINISNAIGGVQVCISTPGGAHDHYSGVNLPQGVSTISGAQALAFVRQRHGLPQGDIDRIKRQERFITAVVQKAKNVRNPVTLNTVLEKVTRSITVDNGLSGLDLIKLGNRLKNMPATKIQFVTVPVANSNAYTTLSNGQPVSYVQLDQAKLQTFFANIKAERDPNAPRPDPLASVTAAAPGGTRVIVENGSGANGVAAAGRAKLESYGFVVDTIGTVAAGTASSIRYNPADAAAAKELAQAVPAATVVADPTLTAGAVVLTLGTSSSAAIHDPAAATPPAPSATSTGGTQTAGGLLTASGGVPCGP